VLIGCLQLLPPAGRQMDLATGWAHSRIVLENTWFPAGHQLLTICVLHVDFSWRPHVRPMAVYIHASNSKGFHIGNTMTIRTTLRYQVQIMKANREVAPGRSAPQSESNRKLAASALSRGIARYGLSGCAGLSPSSPFATHPETA